MREIDSAPIEGKVVDSIERYVATFDDFYFSEVQVAERFSSEALVGNYIWAKELGWLRWEKGRWRAIPSPVMIGVARQWIKDHYVRTAEMVAESRGERNKVLTGRLRDILGHWYQFQSASKIGAVVRLSQPDVVHRIDEFDTKPDLLNVANGVIDLRSKTLMPHDSSLMLTRLSGTDYIPDAEDDDWTKALEAIPEDVRDWFQLRCGQAITGYKPDDDGVIFLRGGGHNGKNTIMEAFLKTLGDYFQVASDKVWNANLNQHSTEVADLYGARMVWLDELPEGTHLPAAKIKKLTSGQLKARKIGQDNMLIEIDFAMFISTNPRPIVTETDEGTWRRLFLVEFPYRFRPPSKKLVRKTDKHGDPGLRQRLKTGRRQREAILAWLVEGARQWYAMDCDMSGAEPESIARAREEWRKDEDVIWRFVEERIEFHPDAHIMSTTLYEQYKTWIVTHGQPAWAEANFNKQFVNHDLIVPHNIVKKKTKRGSGLSVPSGVVVWSSISDSYQAWHGVRFKDPEITFEM